MRYVMTRRGHL